MAENTGVWVKVWPDFTGGAPGAAVIGGATGSVTESSFTGDGTNGDLGQAYDVYEFLGSGQLVVDEPGMVDALAVGGGGGGTNGNGVNTYPGGSGAGGLLQAYEVYLGAGAPTVKVGAGGTHVGELANGQAGTQGETSHLHPIYAPGGGRGGTYFLKSGGHGGSSGGCCSDGTVAAPPVDGLGNAGGTAAGIPNAGGGGGGAGSVGANAASGNGGAGGSGVDVSAFIGSSAGTLWLAGGGGAAGITTAGTGTHGGGNGGSTANGNGTDATENTGGGAGGGGNIGGKGGSGILIVRVKVPTESYALRTNTTAPKTAHAARVENGVVRQVIVIPHLEDDDNKITEYCNKIGLPGTWVDTSYTGARRGKYAGVGDTFAMTKSGSEFVSPVVEEIE